MGEISNHNRAPLPICSNDGLRFVSRVSMIANSPISVPSAGLAGNTNSPEGNSTSRSPGLAPCQTVRVIADALNEDRWLNLTLFERVLIRQVGPL
jgi:hypothetical protein